MARIRTIKPEFFTSEDIFGMTPLARLFYVSLWCESDREGRLEWKPGTFKARYLPADDCDINVLGRELIDNGLIILYEAGGKTYAEIPTFTEHQVINNREGPSKIPARDDNATFTRESGVKAEGKEGREGREGREGKGGEGVCPDQGPNAPAGKPDVEHAEKREKRRPTEDDLKTASWLYGCLLSVNPDAKKPNFDTWADDVRLMREVDKREHRAICELFKFAKSDSFWAPNIQSPAKLREKWDALTELRQRPARAGNDRPKDPRFFGLEAIDRSGDAIAMAASMERHKIVVGDDDDLSFDLPGRQQ